MVAPLDFQTILVNTLAGSNLIFWIIGIITIILIGGYLKMPEVTVGIFALIFTFITLSNFETATTQAISFIIIVIVAIFAALIIRKIVSKQ